MLLLLLATNTSCMFSGIFNNGGDLEINDSLPSYTDFSQSVVIIDPMLSYLELDDTTYYFSGRSVDSEITEGDLFGRLVTSTGISEQEPCARYENGVIVKGTQEWVLYLTEEELLGSIPPRQDAHNTRCIAHDFVMILSTDKEVYSSTDRIQIWSTLEYIGDEDQTTIWHGIPYMVYSIVGNNGFKSEGFTLTILMSTILEKDKVYFYLYQKSGGWDNNALDASYWKEFYRTTELYLPAGEYTISLIGYFSLSRSMIDSHSGLLCELTIKVVE